MRRAVIAAVAVMACGAARADWQYARWGMTPEEVQAAGGTAIARATPRQERDWSVETLGRAMLHTRHTAQSMHYSVRFLFSSGRLVGVYLAQPTYREAVKTRETLGQIYGTPNRIERRSGFCNNTARHWDHHESGNTIMFSEHVCPSAHDLSRGFILYRPLISQRGSGL